ncbi:MAG: biotin-dependent carboxyltransferase family protein [Syntrophales bacterium LBB04]|nr:biotin-dependent carboxyltransferase family protein [Syntrophales bacterium LBB04]
MIEIIHPGIMSIVVDGGRYGYREVGIPTSPALDLYALSVLNCLLGNEGNAPAIEVFGEKFSLRFGRDICCAITGAKVRASLEGRPLQSWMSFEAKSGETLTVDEVREGFRYYVGFSGAPVLKKIIGSYTTNLECRFGGYRGRALQKGDSIDFEEIRMVNVERITEEFIPRMMPPHTLRVVEGPESNYFTDESLGEFMNSKGGTAFTVSTKLNRTGIRLDGKPLAFRTDAEESIISEGLLPGSIQVPGDGLPIIQLHERTLGGYARPVLIAQVDHDLLAHLKPGDSVIFKMIGMEEAERLFDRKIEIVTSIKN